MKPDEGPRKWYDHTISEIIKKVTLKDLFKALIVFVVVKTLIESVF